MGAINSQCISWQGDIEQILRKNDFMPRNCFRLMIHSFSFQVSCQVPSVALSIARE